MNNIHMVLIFAVAIILMGLGFMLGEEMGKANSPQPVLRDIVQQQEYFNELISNMLNPPVFEVEGVIFTELDVDGKIGARTIEVWEKLGANFYGVEK